MTRDTSALSPEGAARRDAMLGPLLEDMRQHHRRRRTRRRLFVSSGYGLLIALLVITVPRLHPAKSPVTNVAESTIPEQPTPRDPAAVIEWVSTNRSVMDRYRPATTFTATLIDDDALLDTLAMLDRPAGLIRQNGRVWLTAAVTDEDKDG